jgi:hypothetical protein
MTALSIMRWPANNHLFVLGILSFGTGFIGRTARRRGRWAGVRGHPKRCAPIPPSSSASWAFSQTKGFT